MPDLPPPSGSVWDRPAPRPRRGSPPLSRDAVVDAAMRLADDDGLDLVSVRNVAAALGAGPMRLYGVVGTKDELLELMVDAVYGEIYAELPMTHRRGPQPWPRRATAVARATRAVTLRHEWFVDLVAGRPQLGPHRLAVLEATAAALSDTTAKRRTGARGAADLWADVGVFTAFLAGTLRAEVTGLRVERRTGVDEDTWRSAVAPRLGTLLDSGRYPVLQSLLSYGPPPDDTTLFEQQLARVLAGLESPPVRGRRARR